MRLREIADRLGCRLEGDGELEIAGVTGMEDAGPAHLTFLANPKYAPKVKHTKAGGPGRFSRAVSTATQRYLAQASPPP